MTEEHGVAELDTTERLTLDFTSHATSLLFLLPPLMVPSCPWDKGQTP